MVSLIPSQSSVWLGEQFRKYLGGKTELATKVFDGGSAAFEAFLAGEVDVGPRPAVTGRVCPGGQTLKALQETASGGAVFVTCKDTQLKHKEEYFRKRFASPQIEILGTFLS